MTTERHLREDLQYIRSAVERQKEGILPKPIALLWSGFVLIGFIGLDLRPDLGAPFLMVGAPILYVLSLRFGKNWVRSSGTGDRAAGRVYLLHWGSIFPAGGALLLLAAGSGDLSGKLLGQILLILVGLVYLLGGIHFRVRTLMGVGIAMMGAGVLLTYLESWGWTGIGIVLAAGILASSRKTVAYA